MKKISVTLGAGILCCGIVFAQQSPSTAETMPATTAESAGSSWTGLLVTATCEASSNMPAASAYNTNPSYNTNRSYNTSQEYNRGTADRVSDATTARATTPVNESNTTYEQSVNQADRNRIATSAADTVTNRRGTPPDMTARTSSDMNARTSSPDMNARTTSPEMSAQSGMNANDMHRASMGRSDSTSMSSQTMPSQTMNSQNGKWQNGSSQPGYMNRRTSPNQSSTMSDDMNSADRSMSAYNQPGSQNSGWAEAQQVASQMPDACRITTATSNFALRTPDGRVYVFDDASNARIREQLNGRVAAHEMKIFRVVVRGNLQGQTLTLDSIQL